MTGHVGDFGLARFLFERSNNQSTSTGIKGSIGYVPPEYGMGVQVSIFGDAFGYGVILLEMFTTKSPTNDMFKDGRSFHEFVAAAWPEQLTEIVDPLLFLEEVEIKNDRDESPIVHEGSRSGINTRAKSKKAWFQ
ncbi:probable LRR receptor-like serine/threonine-protein kinase At3g47570 [Macadamia integrifolia]|uniref:probable LRR receptor-like serine/threonine-protein kinase At3g47570 n=1 Tax=Macadamia integrifolia TaxID=60698 RepID=UPI001C4FF143|nr:probable LRR receptor-like serine/threonine-protein kinase At3g47570 [Macadamia integrifolia]